MGSQERKNDQRVIRQFASSLFGNIVCMKDQKYMIMNTKEYPILRRAPRSDPRLQLSVVTPKTSIARLLHRLDQCGEGGREGEESERVENWRVADCPAMSFVFVC